MNRPLLLKLGGSLITDKTRPYTPRPETLRQVAGILCAARAAHPEMELVLGHGSGSFGHYAARESGFGQPGRWESFARTGAAAARLNRLVTDLCLEAGLPVVSLQPSASARCRDGELVDLAVEPIRAALSHGLVPIVFGDVALDETRAMTIVSTEMLFAYLAPRLGADRILLVSEVEGVHAADPRRHPGSKLLSELTTDELARGGTEIGGSHGVDVTGGMADKVRRMLALAREHPHLEIRIVGLAGLEAALVRAFPAPGTRLRA